jgi:hypothetical protein
MSGVYLDYYLPEIHDSLEVQMDILQHDQIIRSYTSKKDGSFKSWPGGPGPKTILPHKKGFNRTHWDFRREQLPSVDQVFVYGDYSGSRVAPGNYKARLSYGAEVKEVEFNILPNPNRDYLAADFEEQQMLLINIEKAIKRIHQSVSEMRSVQSQLQHYSKILKGKSTYSALYDEALAIEEQLKKWEAELIQPEQKTFQDVINFNNKLNAEWMHLKSYVDAEDPKVTQGAKDRYQDLLTQWKIHEQALEGVIEKEFKSFEKAYREANVPVLIVNLDSE